MGPHLLEGVHQDPANFEARVGRCLPNRVGLVVLGTGWMYATPVLGQSAHARR